MDESSRKKTFPPVVSVLGHVDHGKTSLLDKIRSSNQADREHGGITQKIGASEIVVKHEGEDRRITFIDTPGHEAFQNMRSHGVAACDIALLVVASDDGVMPQTKESIVKILESKIPFIVVFTKIDLESANIEKVKQQVMHEGILLEGLGGNTPFIGVSSKTGVGVNELLDLIILSYDLSGKIKEENADFLGIVIESKLDKRRGNLASLIVKQGKIKVGERIYSENGEAGKVRALFNSHVVSVKEAFPGDAIEIIGLSEVLTTGSLVYLHSIEKKVETKVEVKAEAISAYAKIFGEDEGGKLPIVLKTESRGEEEAVLASLPESVKVVYVSQGDVSVSDVLMAKDLKAIVVGFNVQISKDAQILAENQKVFYRIYKIIYELIDEVSEATEAFLKSDEEQILGKAEVLASFGEKDKKILGIKVIDGRVVVGDKVKVMHGDLELGKSKILSLRRGKEEVKKVEKDVECGMQLSPFVDFSVGDVILSCS